MTSYETLPATTRVWIYQSSRVLTDTEATEVEPLVARFAQDWISHNRQLRAFGGLFHRQFVVLMVDESLAGASGCSIDKSVHFVKQLENKLAVNFFDRMTFTYQEEGNVKMANREEFAKLYAEGKINDETLVFDNLVSNKGDFDTAWIKPLGKSWHLRMV